MIIMQQDDSSSSGSEESDPLPVKSKSLFGKSHKRINKKSVIKVHKQEEKQSTNNSAHMRATSIA